MRLFASILAFASAAVFAAPPHPRLIAHRGLAQQYSREGLAAGTCTAARMLPPSHGYLENTIAAMRAAFDAGAEAVEFDIHPTTDGEFVVFHDWTLDCRTDGHGVTREQPLAYLKSLDIGHGYTADGGRTFPFRGKLVGAMPTWAEVMAAFPNRRFLVNIKSNDPREAALVAAYADAHGFDLSTLSFYGGDRPVAALRKHWPHVQTMSRATLTACAWTYVLAGWTGYVPKPCRHSILFVPINVQHWIWGWPERFVARMGAHGTDVAIIGPLESRTGGDSVIDLDGAAGLGRIPAGYRGLIFTERIDAVRSSP